MQIVTNIGVTFGDRRNVLFKRHGPSVRPIDINLGQSRHYINGGGSIGHHNLHLRTTSTEESQKHIFILTLPGKKSKISIATSLVSIVVGGHGRVAKT